MRKAALWQFKYDGTKENLINYKKAEAKARNWLKIEGIIHILHRVCGPSYVWGKIKAFKSQWKYVGNVNEYKEQNMNEARNVISEIFPPSAPSTPPPLRLECDEDPFLDLPFSEEELGRAVSNLTISSSPGPDRIVCRMVCHQLGRR
jgi:hypothetical protein